MQIALMTAGMVKSLLAITSTDYDSQIALQLPLVSMDVRKYLNQNYQRWYVASYKAGENTIQIIHPVLDIGTVLQGTGIPDDTYITSYDPVTDRYTVSETFTDSDDYVYPTISIHQWSAISRMIMYKITKMTAASATEKGIVSKSIDSVSYTYTDDEINKSFGYPQKLLDELGTRYARIG